MWGLLCLQVYNRIRRLVFAPKPYQHVLPFELLSILRLSEPSLGHHLRSEQPFESDDNAFQNLFCHSATASIHHGYLNQSTTMDTPASLL